MAYAEKRKGRDGKDYYRIRYKRPDGKWGVLQDTDGTAIKFPTKRLALKAGRDVEADEEAKARSGRWVPAEAGRITVAEYVDRWWEAQDLAESTMQSYRHYLKHLLPRFGDMALAEIDGKAVDAWEKEKRAAGVAASSLRTYRAVLHLILADAVDEGLLATNPAARRRGRGKRAGRSTHRGPEKKITNSIGALLIAERAALLSGRDDEFVACILIAYTGMRWGEVVGLEPVYVRDETLRVEQQLYELDSGGLSLCPPKDDSYRSIDVPRWLSSLVRGHTGRTSPKPCSCHGKAFVFRGRGTGRRGSRTGPTLADVAREAGVSTGTVSNVLNRPERVRGDTRSRVEKVIAELEFVRGGTVTEEAAHWRRSGFVTWVFEPATSGWYPAKVPQPRRPVPLAACPWPGMPLRGRGAGDRSEACWLPIQDSLTRHGLRHSHRTLMEQLGTPKVLMDERMGHTDGSVSARYAHVTDAMRRRLREALTEEWETSLDARLRLSPSSSVPVLDRLLRERASGG